MTFGCTTSAAPTLERKTEIVIDPSTSKDTLAPWLVYAGARSIWMETKFYQEYPAESSYRYTFREEFEARDSCAMLWIKLKEKDGLQNRYLDDLTMVKRSGFLREYIWSYFKNSDWKEPEDLRLDDFAKWRYVHLTEHIPETRAVARFKGR